MASKLLANKTVSFIGLGKMASYMLRPLLAAEVLRPEQVIATNRADSLKAVAESFPGVRVTDNNLEAVQQSDLVIWGTKPQDFKEIAQPVSGRIPEQTCVLSIMGGIKVQELEETFKHTNMARCMPNVPVCIGQGVVPFVCGSNVAPETEKMVKATLDAMGGGVKLTQEKQIDMATAVSGSSPAYFFLVLESLVETGVHLGLSRTVAFELASRSMAGSASMALEVKDLGLAEHKYAVTSPGGITAAALHQAEKLALRATISEIVWAAFRRSLEIGDDKVYGPGFWEPRRH